MSVQRTGYKINSNTSSSGSEAGPFFEAMSYCVQYFDFDIDTDTHPSTCTSTKSVAAFVVGLFVNSIRSRRFLVLCIIVYVSNVSNVDRDFGSAFAASVSLRRRTGWSSLLSVLVLPYIYEALTYGSIRTTDRVDAP